METTRLARPGGSIRLRFLFSLAVVCACLALAWMLLLPLAVARYVRGHTGFGIEVRSLYVNPFTANVAVRGLVITNPPDFPRKDFFEVREFRADAELFSLFGSRVVVDDAAIDVAGITIVRNGRGLLNVTQFQQGLAGPPAPAGAPGGTSGPARPPRQFLIKRLTIGCDRVVMADYSRRRPDVREVNLRFHHVYTDVTSPQQLAAPLAQVLSPFAAALGIITPQADSALRSAGGLLKETGRQTGAAVKGFFEALEKSLKK